ncbi:uncharacterized protein LOC135494374 [Lineus longissimus]|uniref:uncharacterized protein LOC135494374 n=1 Tax=Lineus longissimus TaxID=88925 RepID=UPI00315D4D74
MANEWKLWLECYDSYCLASGVDRKGAEVQKHTFLHCVGMKTRRKFDNLQGEKGTVQQCKDLLTTYFVPKRNVVAERYSFRSRAQKDDETVDTYSNILRELAKTCEFGNLEDEMLRDQIVEKCRSSKLREKFLGQETLTLDKVLKMARLFEQATAEAKVMNAGASSKTHSVDRVQSTSDKKGRSPFHTSKECFRCGRTDHAPDTCGARTAVCNTCGAKGHYSRKCSEKKEKGDTASEKKDNAAKFKRKPRNKPRKTVRHVREENADSDEEFVWSISSKSKERGQPVLVL